MKIIQISKSWVLQFSFLQKINAVDAGEFGIPASSVHAGISVVGAWRYWYSCTISSVLYLCHRTIATNPSIKTVAVTANSTSRDLKPLILEEEGRNLSFLL
jgi:hypothetical protein